MRTWEVEDRYILIYIYIYIYILYVIGIIVTKSQKKQTGC